VTTCNGYWLYRRARGNNYMEGRNISTFILIMAFFTTLTFSKQQVAANGDIPIVNNISISSNISSNLVFEEDYENIMLEHLLEYKQSKIKERLQKQTELNSLEKQIRDYVGQDINNFGMVYYDINSKTAIEINSDKQFVAASTIKVPINMLMFDMIADKKIDINEKLQYIEVDYEDGAGILQGSDLSNPISIKTLSEYSIIYSDNIAINMLLRKVGNENRYNFIEETVGHAIEHEGNYTTPKDSFKILERLYTNPDKNKYYNDIIETMKKTEFHDRINKYIPKEIVAHKIGDYAEYVNDMGIVYTEKPYILAVFTKDMPEAYETIGQVSKIIYEAHK
jgi:beta-lactamase class A